MKTLLVTGCAGFIGSNFVHTFLANGRDAKVINLDKLTYAGNLANLAALQNDPRHVFVQGDIGDRALVERLLQEHQPDAVVNFAAESHVDRSIHGPGDFIQTNVVGTFNLLEAVRAYWTTLPATPVMASEARPSQPSFRFLHVSNNYGPYHFPEKLIPLVIHNALAGKPLPIYGDGQQVRDWLYVEDHCRAILRVLEAGQLGETYNIGGWNEKANLDVVRTLCAILDELKPRADGQPYASQITYVKDRPGHDRRYAIDARKIERELGWKPEETFETGIRKTVQWYLDHPDWVDNVTSGNYRNWLAQHYGA